MTWPIVILVCQAAVSVSVLVFWWRLRKRPTIIIRNVDFDNVLWLPTRDSQRGPMRIVIVNNRVHVGDHHQGPPIWVGAKEKSGGPYR